MHLCIYDPMRRRHKNEISNSINRAGDHSHSRLTLTFGLVNRIFGKLLSNEQKHTSYPAPIAAFFRIYLSSGSSFVTKASAIAKKYICNIAITIYNYTTVRNMCPKQNIVLRVAVNQQNYKRISLLLDAMSQQVNVNCSPAIQYVMA